MDKDYSEAPSATFEDFLQWDYIFRLKEALANVEYVARMRSLHKPPNEDKMSNALIEIAQLLRKVIQ